LRAISPTAHDAFIATVHRLILGVTLTWLGDADSARELLVEAARRADDDDNHLAYMCAHGYQALFVTPNTLKTHLRAIYRKLGAESREEAVIRAREGGLI
jgi:cyanophycinase-like exopeptidase